MENMREWTRSVSIDRPNIDMISKSIYCYSNHRNNFQTLIDDVAASDMIAVPAKHSLLELLDDGIALASRGRAFQPLLFLLFRPGWSKIHAQ